MNARDEYGLTTPKKMTPEEAVAVLSSLASSGDYEMAHVEADNVLCALLRFHGHDDVVAAWDKVGKWYA